MSRYGLYGSFSVVILPLLLLLIITHILTSQVLRVLLTR